MISLEESIKQAKQELETLAYILSVDITKIKKELGE